MNDKLRLGSFEGRPCDLICAEVSAKTSEITISTNLLLSVSSLFHIKIYFTRTQTHSHNSESHTLTPLTSLDFGATIQNTSLGQEFQSDCTGIILPMDRGLITKHNGLYETHLDLITHLAVMSQILCHKMILWLKCVCIHLKMILQQSEGTTLQLIIFYLSLAGEQGGPWSSLVAASCVTPLPHPRKVEIAGPTLPSCCAGWTPTG